MTANPAKLSTRVAFGTQEDGATSTQRDFRCSGETMGIEMPTIEDDSILDTAEESEGLPTKIPVDGGLNVNYAAEDHFPFLAQFHEKGSTPVEAPTGVWLQRLQVSETAVTFPEWLQVEIDRDQGQPDVYRQQGVSQYTFEVGPRSIGRGVISLMGARFDTWEAATVLAVTATPNPPRLRGLSSYAHRVSADGNVFVRINGAPAGNDITIEVKIGAAAAYNLSQVVTAGEWTEITDEDGNEIGTKDLPVEIYFPDATLTTLDEWRIDRERALWTRVLPVASPSNEILTTILVDGAKFRVRGVTYTAARPLDPDEVVGGRFTDDFIEQGVRTVNGQISRKAVGKDLFERILRTTSFGLRIDRIGTLIGATGIRRRWSSIMTRCIPQGRSSSVSDRGTFDEAVDWRAHPDNDATYPSSLAEELVTSIADIAA